MKNIYIHFYLLSYALIFYSCCNLCLEAKKSKDLGEYLSRKYESKRPKNIRNSSYKDMSVEKKKSKFQNKLEKRFEITDSIRNKKSLQKKCLDSYINHHLNRQSNISDILDIFPKSCEAHKHESEDLKSNSGSTTNKIPKIASQKKSPKPDLNSIPCGEVYCNCNKHEKNILDCTKSNKISNIFSRFESTIPLETKINSPLNEFLLPYCGHGYNKVTDSHLSNRHTKQHQNKSNAISKDIKTKRNSKSKNKTHKTSKKPKDRTHKSNRLNSSKPKPTIKESNDSKNRVDKQKNPIKNSNKIEKDNLSTGIKEETQNIDITKPGNLNSIFTEVSNQIKNVGEKNTTESVWNLDGITPPIAENIKEILMNYFSWYRENINRNAQLNDIIHILLNNSSENLALINTNIGINSIIGSNGLPIQDAKNKREILLNFVQYYKTHINPNIQDKDIISLLFNNDGSLIKNEVNINKTEEIIDKTEESINKKEFSIDFIARSNGIKIPNAEKRNEILMNYYNWYIENINEDIELNDIMYILLRNSADNLALMNPDIDLKFLIDKKGLPIQDAKNKREILLNFVQYCKLILP